MVRDFRSDPTERLRRSKLSYLSNVPAVDELPVRVVHPIQRLRQLSMQSRDAMDAWARHAAAANGFGDGGMASEGGNASDGAIVERAERPRVRKHLSLARHRMRAMGEAIAAVIWVAYWLIASFIRSRARTPQAAPTYRAVTPKPRPIPTLRQSRVS
jgi:hypothetical protein